MSFPLPSVDAPVPVIRVFSQEIVHGGNWKSSVMKMDACTEPLIAYVCQNFDFGEFINKIAFFNNKRILRGIDHVQMWLCVFDHDSNKSYGTEMQAVRVPSSTQPNQDLDGWFTVSVVNDTCVLPMTSASQNRDTIILLPASFSSTTMYFNTISVPECWRREIITNHYKNDTLMSIPSTIFSTPLHAGTTWDVCNFQDPFSDTIQSLNYITWTPDINCLVIKYENIKVVDWKNHQDMTAAQLFATFDSSIDRWVYPQSNQSTASLTDVQVRVKHELDVPITRHWKRAEVSTHSGTSDLEPNEIKLDDCFRTESEV